MAVRNRPRAAGLFPPSSHDTALPRRSVSHEYDTDRYQRFRRAVSPGQRAGFPARRRSCATCSCAGCGRSCGGPTTTWPCSASGWTTGGVRRPTLRARRHRPAAVHGEDRPARHVSVRAVRQPDARRRAPARLQRHDRQADRRGLHAGGRGGLDRASCVRALARLRPARGRHHAERLRLRAVHRRPGAHYGAEALGATVIPDLRRQHRPADHGDEGLRRRRPSAARPATSCT